MHTLYEYVHLSVHKLYTLYLNKTYIKISTVNFPLCRIATVPCKCQKKKTKLKKKTPNVILFLENDLSLLKCPIRKFGISA